MKAIKSTIAQTGPALYIKALILGTAVGCTVMALLMCMVSAVLLVSGKLPHNSVKWIMIVLSAVTAFISGYITSRVTKANGLVWGALSGVIFFIIILLAGLIDGDGNFTFITIIKFFVFVLFGALGGIKGVNKKERIHIK